PHDGAHHLGALLILRLVRQPMVLEHPVDDPPLHRLEPVAHVRQGPRGDHRQRVVQVPAPRLYMQRRGDLRRRRRRPVSSRTSAPSSALRALRLLPPSVAEHAHLFRHCGVCNTARRPAQISSAGGQALPFPGWFGFTSSFPTSAARCASTFCASWVGTSSYPMTSIVKYPMPLVSERSSGAYVRSSACGACAWISVPFEVGSIPKIFPRREVRSAITSPSISSGTTTSNRIIGSSSTGRAEASAFFSAIDPAIRNAMSELSTVWNDPSTSVTLKSTSGKPPSGPCFAASRIPCSTEGMKFRGMTPPTMPSSNSTPDPRGSGSSSMWQSPYCPRPPLCRLYLPCAFALPVTVSWYAGCGSSRWTSTSNFRFSFSIATSMCTCPIPFSSFSFVAGSRTISS